jgi:nitroreductase
MQKPAMTATPIDDLIAARWSPRAYDATKTVTQQQILSLLEAARWAPSCFGDQPWRFVVCDKTSNPQAWQQAYDCLVPGNQAWAVNAPLLILICADTLFSHNQKPNRWASYDTGAATENLCLQATSLGLAAHQMGGFDGAKARELFNIPVQIEMMAMVSVGVMAEAETLPDELREREQAARTRRSLGELFFNGLWDKPVV